MEKLILSDGTEIELQPGGSISSLYTVLNSFDALETLSNFLKKEGNLKELTIMINDEVTGSYLNMAQDTTFKSVNVVGSMISVEMAFRKMTKEELESDSVNTAISYLSDDQAMMVKDLYADWESDPVGYPYDEDNPKDLRRRYSDRLWRLQKSHSKQLDWYPGADPTLWTEIVEGHSGTYDDPIPVPSSVTVSGFEYEYGKYYLDGENIYLCKRAGVENPEEMYGQKEILYFYPSSLVGTYFELT